MTTKKTTKNVDKGMTLGLTLGDRVYCGLANRGKGVFVGKKYDVTSDFINTLLAYIPPGKLKSIYRAGGQHEVTYIAVKSGEKVVIDGKEIDIDDKGREQ